MPDPANPLERWEWATARQCSGGQVAKAILQHLAIRDGSERHAYPGNDLLAARQQLGVRSVHNALKSLIADGFVVRIEEGRGLKAAVYRLDYSIQPASSAVQPASSADRNVIQPALDADRNAIPTGTSCRPTRIGELGREGETRVRAHTPSAPARELVDLWNDVTAGSLAPSTGDMNTLMALRIAAETNPGLDWRAVFVAVAGSEWHRGKNKRGWMASLTWVVQSRNLPKMIELANKPPPPSEQGRRAVDALHRRNDTTHANAMTPLTHDQQAAADATREEIARRRRFAHEVPTPRA